MMGLREYWDFLMQMNLSTLLDLKNPIWNFQFSTVEHYFLINHFLIEKRLHSLGDSTIHTFFKNIVCKSIIAQNLRIKQGSSFIEGMGIVFLDYGFML